MSADGRAEKFAKGELERTTDVEKGTEGPDEEKGNVERALEEAASVKDDAEKGDVSGQYAGEDGDLQKHGEESQMDEGKGSSSAAR